MTHPSSKSRSQFSLSGKRPSGKLDERIFFLIVTEGKTESRFLNILEAQQDLVLSLLINKIQGLGWLKRRLN